MRLWLQCRQEICTCSHYSFCQDQLASHITDHISCKSPDSLQRPTDVHISSHTHTPLHTLQIHASFVWGGESEREGRKCTTNQLFIIVLLLVLICLCFIIFSFNLKMSSYPAFICLLLDTDCCLMF